MAPLSSSDSATGSGLGFASGMGASPLVSGPRRGHHPCRGRFGYGPLRLGLRNQMRQGVALALAASLLAIVAVSPGAADASCRSRYPEVPCLGPIQSEYGFTGSGYGAL